MYNTLSAPLSITALMLIFGLSAFAQSPCSVYKTVNIAKGLKGSSASPSISANGRYVAFESQTGITENNPGGTYQIFVFDSSTGKVEQITDFKDAGSVAPRVSPDGSKIVFVSGADIDGANPERLNLIYLYDIKTGKYTRITDSGQSFEPSLNYDGSQIAFTTNIDAKPGVSNIFVYDSLSGTTTDITNNIDGLSVNPEISANGKIIAYEFGESLTGRTEIEFYDIVGGSPLPVEVPDTKQGSLSPTLSSRGTLIAFQSDSNESSNNPRNNFNIYLYDKVKKELSQITDEAGAGNAGPDISGDGSTLVFQSSGNFTGQNPEGNIEIFSYDTSSKEFTQVTDYESGGSTGARVSGDGRALVYVFEDTSLKNNPGQKSDIYISSCKEDVNIGASPDILNRLIMAAAVAIVIVLLIKYRRVKSA